MATSARRFLASSSSPFNFSMAFAACARKHPRFRILPRWLLGPRSLSSTSSHPCDGPRGHHNPSPRKSPVKLLLCLVQFVMVLTSSRYQARRFPVGRVGGGSMACICLKGMWYAAIAFT